MLVVCEPLNPIICSRTAAGARPVVPWQDVTKYLVWYCHGEISDGPLATLPLCRAPHLFALEGGVRWRRALVWLGNALVLYDCWC